MPKFPAFLKNLFSHGKGKSHRHKGEGSIPEDSVDCNRMKEFKQEAPKQTPAQTAPAPHQGEGACSLAWQHPPKSCGSARESHFKDVSESARDGSLQQTRHVEYDVLDNLQRNTQDKHQLAESRRDRLERLGGSLDRLEKPCSCSCVECGCMDRDKHNYSALSQSGNSVRPGTLGITSSSESSFSRTGGLSKAQGVSSSHCECSKSVVRHVDSKQRIIGSNDQQQQQQSMTSDYGSLDPSLSLQPGSSCVQSSTVSSQQGNSSMLQTIPKQAMSQMESLSLGQVPDDQLRSHNSGTISNVQTVIQRYPDPSMVRVPTHTEGCGITEVSLPHNPCRRDQDSLHASSGFQQAVPGSSQTVCGSSQTVASHGASNASGSQLIRPFHTRLTSKEERECDFFPSAALNTPIGALRKSRHRICLMLNINQPLVEGIYSPDYMGLAEKLGFETLEIQNFWECNPTDTLWMQWCRRKDGSLLPPFLGTLVSCLEELGRQDVLEDCRGLILEDVSDFNAEQKLLRYYTVHALQRFDCYVNIAEQDMLTIGREILDRLEGVYGLQLCLTLRDVTVGDCQYDRMAQMLEDRCNSKVLIVLTKNYEDSDACQFLMQFAVSLDPGSRNNKLIPLLVDEDVNIPRVLRCLAMLNFHRDRRLGFLWPRLKHAITQ